MFFSEQQQKRTESRQKELKYQLSSLASSKNIIWIKYLCGDILVMQSVELKVETIFFQQLFSELVRMGACKSTVAAKNKTQDIETELFSRK